MTWSNNIFAFLPNNQQKQYEETHFTRATSKQTNKQTNNTKSKPLQKVPLNV